MGNTQKKTDTVLEKIISEIKSSSFDKTEGWHTDAWKK